MSGKLSNREVDVLALLAHAKTSKEIASALSLSVDTIADYRKSLCKKLHLHSTASLVAYASSFIPLQRGMDTNTKPALSYLKSHKAGFKKAFGPKKHVGLKTGGVHSNAKEISVDGGRRFSALIFST